MKGYIVLVQNNEGNFLSNAIKFFTKKMAKKYEVETWTHSMFTVGEVFDEVSVLSAELSQCIMPLKKFRKPKIKYEVYKVKDNIKEKVLDLILKDFYTHYAGESYGFLQLLWFIYRWFMELFGKDVRKKKNWFPGGDVCSEMTFRFLMRRFIFSSQDVVIKNIIKTLNEWTENTIHPVDLAYVMKRFPLVFEKVEEWNG